MCIGAILILFLLYYLPNVALYVVENTHFANPHTPLNKLVVALSRPDAAFWVILPSDDEFSCVVGAGWASGATVTLTVALRLSVLVMFPENVSIPENA